MGVYKIKSTVRESGNTNVANESPLYQDFQCVSEIKLEDTPTSSVIDSAPYALIHFNKLFLFGFNSEQHKNTIIYSEVNDHTYFPNTNFFFTPERTNQYLISGVVFKGDNIIFQTKNETFRFAGANPKDPENSSFTKIHRTLGCISEMAAKEKSSYLVFPSKKGVYAIQQDVYAPDDLYIHCISNPSTKLFSIDKLFNEKYKLDKCVTIS